MLERLAKYAERFDRSHPFVVESLEPDRTNPDLSVEEIAALAQLAGRFGLAPWAGVGRRLAALQRRYLEQLRFSEQYHALMGTQQPND